MPDLNGFSDITCICAYICAYVCLFSSNKSLFRYYLIPIFMLTCREGAYLKYFNKY